MVDTTLSTTEAAELLRCSDDTVRRLIDRGVLRAFRLHDAGHYRITMEDLKAYAEEQGITLPEQK